MQRVRQLNLRVRTCRREGDSRARIRNLALCQPLPSSEPAPRNVSQCEIWWRPTLEERLHLAEHLLGSILHKLFGVSLGGECREGCRKYRVGQDIFWRIITIQCWNREG